MKDWNPQLYKEFEYERTLPSKDLTGKIAHKTYERIADLGCGPGNSTKVLKKAWPKSQIHGIDASQAMLEMAREALPELPFFKMDLSGDLKALGHYDLIYSNAMIQWLPDQRRFFKEVTSHINGGGALAVQIPNVTNMPIQRAVEATAKEHGLLGLAPLTMHEVVDYYDMLEGDFERLEMSETQYYHVMPSHGSLIDWYASTGMKPYLDKLPLKADQEAFKACVLEKIVKAYGKSKQGKVLFPFRRLFIIGHKA